MQKKKILIIDDHSIIRRGLTYLVKDNFPAFEIESESDGHGLMKGIMKSTYDFLILDLNVPNSEPLTLIPNLLSVAPQLRILVYSMYPEDIFAKRVIKLGAKGYLEKSSSEQDFIKALKEIADGGIYLSRKIANELITNTVNNKSQNPFDQLSDREFEIMLLMINGHSPKEVTQILNLRSSTVGTYKLRLFEKLNVRSVVELVRLAANYRLT